MLRLAASLADQAPVSLGEAITGIDNRNVGLLVKAVYHASGQRQFYLVTHFRERQTPGGEPGPAPSSNDLAQLTGPAAAPGRMVARCNDPSRTVATVPSACGLRRANSIMSPGGWHPDKDDLYVVSRTADAAVSPSRAAAWMDVDPHRRSPTTSADSSSWNAAARSSDSAAGNTGSAVHREA